jgi:hypothetical protein
MSCISTRHKFNCICHKSTASWPGMVLSCRPREGDSISIHKTFAVHRQPKRGRARSEKPILGFRQIKLLFTEINDNILVVHKVIWSSANVFEVIANLEKPSKRSAASETGRRSTKKKFSYKQSQSRQKAHEIFVNKIKLLSYGRNDGHTLIYA